MTLDETSQPFELLLSVSRDGPRTLGAQIEDQLRAAIRDGTLKPGARVPSTRDLARQLGVSRRIAVDAYAQLAAEGYLTLRQGARPHVSGAAAGPAGRAGAGAPEPATPRLPLRLPALGPRRLRLPARRLGALAARRARGGHGRRARLLRPARRAASCAPRSPSTSAASAASSPTRRAC